VIFGNGARDDLELSRLVARLRSYGNWAGLWPMSPRLRERFFDRLERQLGRAEAGSLAALIAAMPKTPETAASQQVPQWLFAFDPAGMTTFRTLALLASHPQQAMRVHHEIRTRAESPGEMPYLRACILESLRLWPTAPLVLRQTIEETHWAGGVMPAQTGIIIFAPFFHRDDSRLPFANVFAPEVWSQGRPAEEWPLIPFSAGPARCPGRDLVLMLTSSTIGALLERRRIRLSGRPRLDPNRRLPATLNNYSLRFELSSD
jgi:cytochrome P450